MNILQVHGRTMSFPALVKEFTLYKIITENTGDPMNLELLCYETINEKKEIIVTLKEIFHREFYPLVFAKFPQMFERLVKAQSKIKPIGHKNSLFGTDYDLFSLTDNLK